jgi:CheY-like chemotaxis protein
VYPLWLPAMEPKRAHDVRFWPSHRAVLVSPASRFSARRCELEFGANFGVGTRVAIGTHLTGSVTTLGGSPVARVVVIDDEVRIRILVRAVLERAGHQVTEAANGKDGVRECMCRAPDLVVCDLFMPVCDGYETIVALRKMSRVRILTLIGGPSWCSMDLFAVARMLGADACLAKPFQVDALLDTVTVLLRDPAHRSWSESLSDSLPANPFALSGSGAWIDPR